MAQILCGSAVAFGNSPHTSNLKEHEYLPFSGVTVTSLSLASRTGIPMQRGRSRKPLRYRTLGQAGFFDAGDADIFKKSLEYCSL